MSSAFGMLQILLELFICAQDGDDKEEMLLNVIAACTNVSFYTGAVSITHTINLLLLAVYYSK